ncbi:MAG: MotA/TolQ/ExbB proton channel family protein [Candidatus Poribacteria bacterium]|nr:MotA/TolQ/ExbB proton channel family protein [Candidatus Poribacteria bacterium]
MKRLSLTLVLSGLLMIYSPLLFAQETVAGVSTTTGTVRGTIVDTTTAQTPIAGVRVLLVSTDGTESEAETDSSGEYEKSGIAPGRYLVSIYKDGYGAREGKPVTVVAGGDHYIALKMTKKDTIVTFFAKFGMVFWPLLLCSVAALTFIIERLFTFMRSRSRLGTEQFMASITDSLRNDNIMEAVSTCEEAGGPLANVLKAGLLRYSQAQIEERAITKEEIQESIQEAGLLEIPELERNIPVIGTVAVISPLFGLLGTVMGMISAFTTIALEGTGDPQALAGGISQALLTTAGGLTIAIPCLIFSQIFESWVNKFVLEIELVSTEIVNQLVIGQTS